MLNIAICDDDSFDKDNIIKFLKIYATENCYEFNIDYFKDGIGLLENITSKKIYDLIFLDIIMKPINGIDIARKIRFNDKNTDIVFLTSSSEFALDSYEVHAFDYIVKPISKERLDKVMNRFMNSFAKDKGSQLLINYKQNLSKIYISDIEYIESYEHKVFYHLNSKQILTCRQNLSDIESAVLKEKYFIKPHRSYIINMNFIKNLHNTFVELDCLDKIPISRNNYKFVSDNYLKYKLNRKEVNYID